MGVDINRIRQRREARNKDDEKVTSVNSDWAITGANSLSNIADVLTAGDTDRDGYLSKREVMALIPQLERAFGAKIPDEMASSLAQMPEDEKIPLADFRALSAVHSEAEKIIGNGGSPDDAIQHMRERALEIKAARENPIGQDIGKISADIENLLRSADNGKGWTAFRNDGVLKGKEIDSLIEILSQPALSDDVIPQEIKAVLEHARANGGKLNIDHFVNNMEQGLRNLDTNFDGVLSATELSIPKSSDSQNIPR